MPEKRHTLYTIGYATKPIETFISHLQQYKIDVVADIRSVPYSKVFHEYHKESITAHLQQSGIRYVYLGEELGPRSKEATHYDETGQVQFDRLMQSPLFEQGMVRLSQGIEKGFTVALMCAEKDPATCHRSLLVGYFLTRHNNSEILHIDYNGNIENQQALEQRICQIHGADADLFMSPEEREQHAYKTQLKNTAYRKI